MQLTPTQINQFREDGCLVAENVVTASDLEPVIEEYAAWIDAKARRLHQAGKITDLCENADFAHRFACLYAQCSDIAQGMDIMHMRGQATFAFLHNANLLDAVTALIGPEITCNPIQHIRAKPPSTRGGADFYTVPWHQDLGVTWAEADHSDILTCWLALVDATVENGCMEVLPGVWKQGLLPHQAGAGGAHIPDEALPADINPVAVPVRKGGVVFLHRCTPHRSTPNLTDGVRWSLDLRYQPTGVPTGRPFHPAFIVRSPAHPESILTDHAEWSCRWQEALANSVGIRAHRV